MMNPADTPDCGCCAGIEDLTPRRVGNPPGLASIEYRIGRHGDFLESLRAQLSSTAFPALAALTSRENSDFTLALSDALACSLDVLTFYTERYAQEHYLRTATERLSVVQLARLIGYRPSPGVAASTHLAFTLQEVPGQQPAGTVAAPIVVPMGTRVQSVPGQGEQAQTFETIAPAAARAEWNALAVQTTKVWQPQSGDTELWLDGVATLLQPGDAILILGAERMSDAASTRWAVRVLNSVTPDNPNLRTQVRWTTALGSEFAPGAAGAQVLALRQRMALFGHNAPDANLMGNKDSNIASQIDKLTDTVWVWKNYVIDPAALDLDTDNPKIIAGSWFALVSNEAGTGDADLAGYVGLYRANSVIHCTRNNFAVSGKISRISPDTATDLDPNRFLLRRTLVLAQSEQLPTRPTPLLYPVQGDALTLGQRIPDLMPGQPIALSGTRQRIAIRRGVTGLTAAMDIGAQLELKEGDQLFLLEAASRVIGASVVALTAEVFASLIGNGRVTFRLRVLDRDNRSGYLQCNARQISLAAPAKDDPLQRQIAFIAAGDDAISLGRDSTVLKLGAPLLYVYERSGLRINANVAPATHGETVESVLGDGDAGSANQRFVLTQGPLTWIAANTPGGRQSSLQVRVNEVLWHEVPSLYQAAQESTAGGSSAPRIFETREDDKGMTTLQFGDGLQGARLPSGHGNVRARYRRGLGVGGNLASGKLTTLLSRPLGVTDVINPSPATGGEDPEPLDRARDNAPLTVLTLDRAVSVADYAHFAQAFAGIDKAHALWIPAGPARGMFLTIAGVDGASVPETGDTYGFLRQAMRRYGDPLVPLRLVNYRAGRVRCRLAVKVLNDYSPDVVLKVVDAALHETFGFARRDFGQTISVDEVAAVAQGVTGVEAVQVMQLYRQGQTPGIVPRLFASVPVPSLTGLPLAAELLTLADGPVALEVLP